MFPFPIIYFYNSISRININKILITSDNAIFFATNNGIWIWKNNVCTQIKEIENEQFSELIEDKNHNIWAAGYEKLCIVQSQDENIIVENIEDFSKMDIRALCRTQNGDIWIGTLNSGLFELDPSTFGDFYNETGKGMGDTITMASLSEYYTLSDRGTYLSMKENIELVHELMICQR